MQYLATNYSLGDLQSPIMQLTFCWKVPDVLVFYYLILHTRQHCFVSVPVTE